MTSCCFRSLTVFPSIRPFSLIAWTMSLPCTLRLRIKQAIIGLLITDGLSRRQIAAWDTTAASAPLDTDL